MFLFLLRLQPVRVQLYFQRTCMTKKNDIWGQDFISNIESSLIIQMQVLVPAQIAAVVKGWNSLSTIKAIVTSLSAMTRATSIVSSQPETFVPMLTTNHGC